MLVPIASGSRTDTADKRLAEYFLSRAIEYLKLAQSERSELHRTALEQRALAYWQASKTGT
jgi:hypothetical protein